MSTATPTVPVLMLPKVYTLVEAVVNAMYTNREQDGNGLFADQRTWITNHVTAELMLGIDLEDAMSNYPHGITQAMIACDRYRAQYDYFRELVGWGEAGHESHSDYFYTVLMFTRSTHLSDGHLRAFLSDVAKDMVKMIDAMCAEISMRECIPWSTADTDIERCN